jgi:ferritin-like metal-binding protein YciE
MVVALAVEKFEIVAVAEVVEKFEIVAVAEVVEKFEVAVEEVVAVAAEKMGD